MKPIIKEYLVDGKVNKDLVLLTDIHYYQAKDILRLNQLLDQLKQIKMDYICISGDTFDASKVKDYQLMINWLTKLASLAPVMYGVGNHDLSNNHIEEKNKELFDQLERIPNLYLLDNKKIVKDGIAFHGVTLSLDHYYKFDEKPTHLIPFLTSFKLKKQDYNVLLLHTPIALTRSSYLKENPYDLVLCGHVHGGLTPSCLRKILKGIGFIDPHRKIFRKYAYGLIKKYDSTIIISSGVTKLSHSSRLNVFNFLFSQEITIIKIRNNNC